MKIVLITRDSIYGRYLAAGLWDAGAIDRLILETGRPAWRFYWRKFHRVGPLNAAFQWGLNRWFEREGRRWLPRRDVPPHTRVPTVNGRPFADDELPLGFGTSMIRSGTLAALPFGFLNLHTGWLPDYRGVKSEFWRLFEGEGRPAGWTLHFMTTRLDEGDVVLQGAVSPDGANPAGLRARLLEDAIPEIAAFCHTVRRQGLAGVDRRRQDASRARYFTTPTWREWRAYRRRHRRSGAQTP
jgi:hypothetical protein